LNISHLQRLTSASLGHYGKFMKCIYKFVFYFVMLHTGTGTAIASDGTISFTGGIAASTCTITIIGASSSIAGTGTINMPWVALSLLATSGNVAGSTSFGISLAACATFTGMTTVNAFFESGAGVNGTTGNLINTGTATNTEIELLVANTMTKIIPGSATQAQPTAINLAGVTGVLNYVAQYISTGVAGAGTILSSVTYSLVYN
jgi:major type 1 subunit fimbrin (pilin)